jgi:hypothetical protein
MNASGTLVKMNTQLSDGTASYQLALGESKIEMNNLVGKEISLAHNGLIHCIHCAAKTSKSFGQGFCYTCFQTAPEADESIVRPELSKAHLGIARDMEWAQQHDLIDHFVYLSVTNELKVGVTRHHQIPSRWIDQGAILAIKLASTPNRHIAGIIEVFLKQFVSDKTAWQAMLKKVPENLPNLEEEKIRLGNLLPRELQKYLLPDNTVTTIYYPIKEQPQKITSASFDQEKQIEGILLGIKGQYLIFESGMVFNVRKHSGYFTEISYPDSY